MPLSLLNSPRALFRAVLQTLASVSLTFLLVPRIAVAQGTPEFSPTVQQVGEGVYVAMDTVHRGGANTGFVIGKDGVLVIDSFSDRESARALVKQIERVTNKPILHLIVTHYHLDHVGGSPEFRERGVKITSQKRTSGWIHDGNIEFLRAIGGLNDERRNRVMALPLPDRTIDTSLEISLGDDRRVKLISAPGHTGGDLVVTVPDAGVVFCGDLLWNKLVPTMTDARVSRLRQSLHQVIETKARVFVPGHGPVASLPDVEAFDGYLERLQTLTAAGLEAGLEGDRLAKDVMDKTRAQFGSWDGFDLASADNVRLMAAELRGAAGSPRAPQR